MLFFRRDLASRGGGHICDPFSTVYYNEEHYSTQVRGVGGGRGRCEVRERGGGAANLGYGKKNGGWKFNSIM